MTPHQRFILAVTAIACISLVLISHRVCTTMVESERMMIEAGYEQQAVTSTETFVKDKIWVKKSGPATVEGK